jgi:hypothetical protein
MPVSSCRNLFDALKVFVGSPTTHSPYSVAKDFQTLATGFCAAGAGRLSWGNKPDRVRSGKPPVGARLPYSIDRGSNMAFLRLQSK